MTAEPWKEMLTDLFEISADGRIYWKKQLSSRCSVGSEAGWLSPSGYRQVKFHGRTEWAHRIVFAMANGRWPDGAIDHRNGVKDDNTPSNLREASISENGRNRGMAAHNTSGAKGVTWNKAAKKWQAQIGINGSHKYLGRFETVEEASEAYKVAAALHHGEFAKC